MNKIGTIAWKLSLAIAGVAWFLAVLRSESQLGSFCGHSNPALLRWKEVTLPSLLWCLPPSIAVAAIEPYRPLPNAVLFLTPAWAGILLTLLLSLGSGGWGYVPEASELFHWYAPLGVFVLVAWMRRSVHGRPLFPDSPTANLERGAVRRSDA